MPEAVAFAFVAGVTPLAGLYAAFIVGLITALFGARPAMISGATGALAVVMVGLVHDPRIAEGLGPQYLFATVVLMGILQLFAGVFKLGKFMRPVLHPVMLGFVNGPAIAIFLAQIGQSKVPGTASAGAHGFAGGEWMSGAPLVIIPAPLAGIGIVAGIVIGFGLNVRTPGAHVYEIEGPPFFGSTDGFAELFHPETDPDVVIVDFKRSRVVDQSALQAIEDLAARYAEN